MLIGFLLLFIGVCSGKRIYKEVEFNSTQDISCSLPIYNNNTNSHIYVYRDNVAVHRFNKSVTLPNVQKSNVYTYRINNYTKDDDGSYTCRDNGHLITENKVVMRGVSNDLQESNELFRINVNKANILYPIITSIPNVVLVRVGTNLSVNCINENSDNVGWYYPNKKFFTSGAVLNLSPVMWNHMGLYTCLASNNYSKVNGSTFIYPYATE